MCHHLDLPVPVPQESGLGLEGFCGVSVHRLVPIGRDTPLLLQEPDRLQRTPREGRSLETSGSDTQSFDRSVRSAANAP